MNYAFEIFRETVEDWREKDYLYEIGNINRITVI
jgi:hypothetical protein